MAVNIDKGRPTVGKNKKLYMGCVSEAWATETGNTDMLMANDPSEFTIFQLTIPDEDLDEEALEYLADDEQEQPEPGVSATDNGDT